ncbi:proliferation marker protein Ki-67 isoform X2 [Esox lucius]|uniref:proliferation marker protein Ki-67 isoform X2 n=1 Tax=Esox lucius TaxID=8010 RepID=UPI001477425B|nr:proliferation marker protein Ki-67 isoform X2 [Esox lucius]
MPLHGKIVVIKRSGGDGTEFPLTASCLFGRKPDCDIRIQLPQVSKEHCRIELNENKEVILTNLSSVNPTRVNGEVFQQSERLKHGDLITIIDRSFRFEYPPAPTPKKRRSSIASSSATPQILHETQARDTSTKDGTKSEIKPKGEGILEQKNQNSPFGELYEMFKQDLDSKTPKKAPEPYASRLYSTKLHSPNKVNGVSVISTPKKIDANVSSADAAVTPKSSQTKENSLKVEEVEGKLPNEDILQLIPSSQETPKSKRGSSQHKTPTPVSQRKSRPTTPQRVTASEVVEQISECLTAETQNTQTRRRSKEATPIKSSLTKVEPVNSVTPNNDRTLVSEISMAVTTESTCSPRTSPRSSGKKLQAPDVLCELEATTPTKVEQLSGKRRKSGDLTPEMPVPMSKRKRVSFGGHLEPELFDKHLPPDSPLRKGATPGRRSLCVLKKKQSLLRRASVIGLMKHEQASPKNPSPSKKSPKASPKNPSPAKKSPKASPKTPTPAKKSPKASPKTPTPVKKSPKASPKTPSPAKKSPKESPKTPSPAKKSPKASPRTPSPAKKSPKAKTPSPGKEKNSKTAVRSPSPNQRKTPLKESQTATVSMTPVSLPSAKTTPTIQGRFSVSRISTPSPTTDQDTLPQTSVTVTPRVPLRRKSMKATPKTTTKSALQVIRRRSGLSRASMKVVNSWADIVKFGQTKTQAVIPTKKTTEIRVTKKKAVVPKPKTPVKSLLGHASTGHADSPMTIVVGKAHKLHGGQPAGTAPRLVYNIALQKRNMKMDEDFSGVAEIFKTPARQRNSVANVQSTLITPQTAQSASMIESSVMDTPEETGEMVVSPLVVSTAKRGVYNSDAVIRLLDDQESSFITANDIQEAADDSCSTSNENPSLEISSEESEKEQPETKTKISTPQQKKPQQPECLTGVKRIMKTPRQKTEPIEDLRGKLLKTPKQKKPEQPQFLTGLKRIMKTPKQIAVPIEDLRGKLLKTPRGPKTAPEESLDGVKDLLKSPKPFAQPVEDISGDADNYFHSEENEIHKTISSVALTKVVLSKEPAGVDKVGEPADAPAELIEEQASLDAVEKMENPVSAEVLGPVAAPAEAAVPETLGSKMTATPVPAKSKKSKNTEVTEPLQASVDAPVETVNAVDVQENIDAQSVPAIQPKRGRNVKQASVEQADTQENAVEVKCLEMTPIEDQQPPSDVPVQKSRRGRNAKQASVEQVETVFESTLDAVTVHVPEKVEAQMPVVKSKRGRWPKPDSFETEVLEISPIEVVGSKDRPANVPVVKSQARGGNSKLDLDFMETVSRKERRKKTNQESVEQVESVSVETSIEQDVTQEQTTVAPVENPKRGGRKAKQASLDQVKPVEEQAVEAVTVQVEAEEQTTVAPVEKPKRGGRKAKQASLDQVKPVEEQAVEAVTVQVEAEEQTTVASVEKPKRGGRKAKQASLDQVKPVEEQAVEAGPVQVEAEEQTTVALVEKPKRGGRKAKQASLDQVEPVEEQAVEAGPVHVEAEEQTTVAPVEKPKRGGRKAKQASLDQVEPVEEQTVEAGPVHVEAEEQTTVAPVEKPKRGGRKAKQASLDQVEPVEEQAVEAGPVQVEAEEQTTVAPVEKPKRGGRKAKQASLDQVEPIEEQAIEAVTVQVEAEEQTTVALVEKPKRGGRKAKQASLDQVEPVEEQAVEAGIVQVEAEEQTTVVPVEKPKRGGRRTKQDPESVVPPVDKKAPEETSALPTEKPKRGRKGKQEKVNEVTEVESILRQEVHIPEQTEVDGKPESGEQLEVPVKPGQARKARAVVKDEVPAKRARRGAADFTKVSTATKVPTEPLKRGRRLAKSTVSVDDVTVVADHNPSEAEVTDTEVMAVVVKKEQGKAQKRGMATLETFDQESSVNVPKNTPKSVNWKTNLDVTYEITPLPNQKKSRRNVGAPLHFEEQPKSVEEQQVVKTVRGRRAKMYAEVEEETTKPTQSKRARASATEYLETSAETTDPISKPVNKRNTGRNTKTEEADLSDKAISKEPVKKTRRGAKYTLAAVDEAPSITVTEKVPETDSEAKVVAATKGRGKALKKGKVLSQEIDIEQAMEPLSKPRRGRAARQ